MKKSIKTFLIVMAVILGFVFLPPFIAWLNGEAFKVSLTELRYAVFLGLLTPSLIWLSSKMKSTFLFVVVALVLISLGGFLLHLLFPN
ncbi:hypothetical protein [Maribellus sp. YY47]|uniref:hypothetical protein n=1 Tax=Maribellus sp. YY47 TaxID=2929486 RepID=UPI0020007CA0|nr:hypothetical protein [Maribellus sp. YY47]MCK3685496.1 hypothetical protein [Maribellus sp. YY47]